MARGPIDGRNPDSKMSEREHTRLALDGGVKQVEGGPQLAAGLALVVAREEDAAGTDAKSAG
eukprot:11197828-Lingulodinium_polyedra.AAC.1